MNRTFMAYVEPEVDHFGGDEKIKYFVACHPKMYTVPKKKEEKFTVELMSPLAEFYDLDVDFTGSTHNCIKNEHYEEGHRKYKFDDENLWSGDIKFAIRLIPKDGKDEPEALDPIIVNE